MTRLSGTRAQRLAARWLAAVSLCVCAPLSLAQLAESITVTATRTETRVADTPASVVVLSREDVENTAAPTIDDALRQVAGFTLFRRSGSRVANPTSQGVTLRGVGASGASRALVLDDGVPLNDPFGGWVYWGRVPRASLDRVEVLRGGASDLYGSSAMGGVIQFIRRKSSALSIDASAGSDETGTLSLFAGSARASLAADLFSTGGYVLVRPGQRGAVDVAADSRHASVDGTLRSETMFVRGSYYRESRNNGTPLQVNDTTIRQLAAGAAIGNWSLRAYGTDQDYYQTFSAIADDRQSERLTVEQNVPSRGLGGSAQWTRPLSARHVLVAGAEGRHVRGTSEELRFTNTGTFRVDAGGTQKTAAAYVEDLFAITPALSLTAGLRADWVDSESQLNPRLSALWRANDRLSFAASGYTAFRSPTLNELHRSFRVGNVNTLANPDLGPENLTGFELGARTGNARLTVFWMSVSDAIANVTLSTTPALITRQRRNLGRTRSIGAELDAGWRLGRDWRASASWLYVDATVRDGELRGNRVPQVPWHQATAQVAWRTIGAQLRWSASQFDDDRNALPLDGYFVADLFASHPIRDGLEVTLALENVSDEEVAVSATPVVTLGQPRAVRVGLRYTSVRIRDRL
jgi:outer membrane receptor protein involved in Fe transport